MIIPRIAAAYRRAFGLAPDTKPTPAEDVVAATAARADADEKPDVQPDEPMPTLAEVRAAIAATLSRREDYARARTGYQAENSWAGSSRPSHLVTDKPDGYGACPWDLAWQNLTNEERAWTSG